MLRKLGIAPNNNYQLNNTGKLCRELQEVKLWLVQSVLTLNERFQMLYTYIYCFLRRTAFLESERSSTVTATIAGRLT